MPVAEQHVLFFGGLVRGAIAWAQVCMHACMLVLTWNRPRSGGLTAGGGTSSNAKDD